MPGLGLALVVAVAVASVVVAYLRVNSYGPYFGSFQPPIAAVVTPASLSAACAAARRARGTR